jgi:two-component system LytT family sensor kinase
MPDFYSMFKWIWKYKLRLGLNLIAWCYLFGATYYNGLSYTPAAGTRAGFTMHIILFNLCYVCLVYLNILWLMPRFLFRKRYAAYIFLLLSFTVITAAIMGPYSDWFIQRFKGVDTMALSSVSFGEKGPSLSMVSYCLLIAPTIFMLVFIFGIGSLAQQYFTVARQKELIEQRQVKAELSLLKSQINPHFLFNVLNSIYALSLKKSDMAPEVVLKLSDLMRYMLYEANEETVALDREVDMLLDYIELERVRIDSRQRISVTTQTISGLHRIAPVLLIPFVENAVKHGMDSLAEGAFIELNIYMQDHWLHFYCRNNYKESQQTRKGGIGLENVRKRLQLLYPQRHKLDIRKEAFIFEVELSINLSV